MPPFDHEAPCLSALWLYLMYSYKTDNNYTNNQLNLSITFGWFFNFEKFSTKKCIHFNSTTKNFRWFFLWPEWYSLAPITNHGSFNFALYLYEIMYYIKNMKYADCNMKYRKYAALVVIVSKTQFKKAFGELPSK